MLNTIILQGRLTKDAEIRYTNSQKAVASFTVAVDRGKDKGADFINCVAWENTALFIEKYFRKGDMILIEGRLQQRNYEDKDGNKRTLYEVVVGSVNFCGSKSKSGEASRDVVSAGQTFTELTDDDGDLPF